MYLNAVYNELDNSGVVLTIPLQTRGNKEYTYRLIIMLSNACLLGSTTNYKVNLLQISSGSNELLTPQVPVPPSKPFSLQIILRQVPGNMFQLEASTLVKFDDGSTSGEDNIGKVKVDLFGANKDTLQLRINLKDSTLGKKDIKIHYYFLSVGK